MKFLIAAAALVILLLLLATAAAQEDLPALELVKEEWSCDGNLKLTASCLTGASCWGTATIGGQPIKVTGFAITGDERR